MKNESNVMQELHAIRERMYEETKHMTSAERVEYEKRETGAVIEEFGLIVLDSIPTTQDQEYSESATR